MRTCSCSTASSGFRSGTTWTSWGSRLPGPAEPARDLRSAQPPHGRRCGQRGPRYPRGGTRLRGLQMAAGDRESHRGSPPDHHLRRRWASRLFLRRHHLQPRCHGSLNVIDRPGGSASDWRYSYSSWGQPTLTERTPGSSDVTSPTPPMPLTGCSPAPRDAGPAAERRSHPRTDDARGGAKAEADLGPHEAVRHPPQGARRLQWEPGIPRRGAP